MANNDWRARLGEREKEVSSRPNCNLVTTYDIHNHTVIAIYQDWEAGKLILLRRGVGWFENWDFYQEIQIGTRLRRHVSLASISADITAQLRLAQEDLFSREFGSEAGKELEFERRHYTTWLDPDKTERVYWFGKRAEQSDPLRHLALYEWAQYDEDGKIIQGEDHD